VNVVSDTSPINYLILIGEIRVIPQLFERVTIPLAVQAELMSASAPSAVRSWIDSPPPWVEFRSGRPLDTDALVGAGELEAISLAQELHLPLLMDDSVARSVASRLGVANNSPSGP